ncbi:MAG: hypothetical protein NTV51_13815 [Verrucomicrobia bacterium]|nr:hypothetical protein [Verrucomicrobiota bacterium]
MKPFWPALFLGSLALNAALILLFLVGAASSTSDSDALTASASVVTTPKSVAATPVVDSSVWPRLQVAEGDFPGLIARLRAAGFPPTVIRGIVTGLVQEKFAARRKALDPGLGTRPFWKNDRPPDPSILLALHQLNREQVRTIRELLGPETEEEEDPVMTASRQRQLGFLPPERAASVRAITERYEQLREDLRNPAGQLPADRARQAELGREERAALAQVLSPRELEEYDLRSSDTANNLRYQLTQFDATESEFVALFRLQRPFDEKFNGLPFMPSEEQAQQRTDAEKLLNEQIKATLGPDRYADYERSTDYNYRRTAQLVARLDLPPAAAPQVWSVQKDIQRRAEPVSADPRLSETQRATQLAALISEATDRLTATLGPRGFAEYQRNGGTWLRELAPPPPPKP